MRAMQLSGELSKVSLANLIQLVRNGQLTGKIEFWQGAKTAALYVERGAIIHAEFDTIQGREALMELFLWVNGSFSFLEEPLGLISRTLNPFLPEDSTDRLLREGLAFLEQKKYLDQLRISGQTILKPTEAAQHAAPALLNLVDPIMRNIDGRKTIAQALVSVHLSRSEYVRAVCACLMEGLAVVVEAPANVEDERIELPPWVVARLKQDNVQISQAIVDLVIWVDRVKCWMFQADADFGSIVSKLGKSTDGVDSDEDFFKEIEQHGGDLQGPFFGESMPGAPLAVSDTDQSVQSSQKQKPAAPPQSPPQSPPSNPMQTARKPPSIEF